MTAANSSAGMRRSKDALLQLVEAGAPERHVVDAGEKRAEVGVVLRLAGRQADGAHGAAVEGAEEGDDVRPARVVARQLEARLDRLRAGVADEDAGRPAHRRDPGEPLGRLGVDGQVEVRGAEVDELGGLLRDRGD